MVANFSKKGNREILMFQAAGIVFFAIILVLIVADFKIYQKKHELTMQLADLQKQVAGIKNSSQTLKEEIANSNNNDYLEKIAYEQLGQQKPGEKEYIFTQPPEKPKAPAAAQNPFDSFLNWLKSKF